MSQSGNVIQTLKYDHTVSVGTTNWVQLDAALDGDVSAIEIFDSSGSILELGIGAAGSEQRVLYIVPGGGGRYNFILCKDQRLAVRAIDTATAAGQWLIINFFE